MDNLFDNFSSRDLSIAPNLAENFDVMKDAYYSTKDKTKRNNIEDNTEYAIVGYNVLYSYYTGKDNYLFHNPRFKYNIPLSHILSIPKNHIAPLMYNKAQFTNFEQYEKLVSVSYSAQEYARTNCGRNNYDYCHNNYINLYKAIYFGSSTFFEDFPNFADPQLRLEYNDKMDAAVGAESSNPNSLIGAIKRGFNSVNDSLNNVIRADDIRKSVTGQKELIFGAAITLGAIFLINK